MSMWSLVSLIALVGCAKPMTVETPFVEAPPISVAAPALNVDAVAGIDSPVLQRLLSDHWETTMVNAPTWATALGDTRYNDKLGDGSPAASARYTAERAAFLVRARAIDASALNSVDRTTLELFIDDLAFDTASEVCRFEQWSISPRGNPSVSYNDLADTHPLETVQNGLDFTARLGQLPGVVDDDIAQLRLGLAEGWVVNADTAALVVEQVERQLASADEEWALALVRGTTSFDDADNAAFDARVLDAIGPFRAALQTYLAFLKAEVLPVARPADAVGLGALPDGPACYESRVRAYTTLDRPAADIHQLGLDQMAKIHVEFQDVGERVFGTRDIGEIFEHLRTDEDLLFTTAEEVQQTAEQALQDAREAMVQAFGRLPQAECNVRPVPANEAPYTTIAYYRQPAPDGSRPGTYYVNTYAPQTRPRHEARVLAYHEAIPGHHLQIAIAQELPDMPAFRRHMGMTAFVEGWALYTERLSDELGLYPEDVDRLGMLSFDAWRAARLVVDTGIHSQGWTREQAESYMQEQTPLATNNIANEVDRYISWPGQALAYKTGQLHIWDLRRKAEEQLGDDFNLSTFHDVVLGGGAVSLPVLTRRVDAWLAEQG